jgi:hypothetical protein
MEHVLVEESLFLAEDLQAIKNIKRVVPKCKDRQFPQG